MKNTAKLILVIAFAVIIGIAFTSCPEDDPFPTDLAYKWYGSAALASIEEGALFEFKTSGDYFLAGVKTATCTVSGDVITMNDSATGLIKLGSCKYKISGKKLTISATDKVAPPNGEYYRK